MTTKRAVLNAPANNRVALAAFAGLIAAAMLLLGFSGTASAAKRIGAGGKIHTCYKAKGKAKGSLRVVPAGKKCKRGWRKLAWSTTGKVGAPGAGGAGGAGGASGNGGSGQAGAGGSEGAKGSDGASGSDNTALLESKVAALSLQVEGLEGLLEGVGKGELQGALGTLDGVTNAELTEAVGLAPVVESVCTQVSGLTGGLDAVNEGVKGLGILGLAGLSLSGLSALPTNLLDSYDCGI